MIRALCGNGAGSDLAAENRGWEAQDYPVFLPWQIPATSPLNLFFDSEPGLI